MANENGYCPKCNADLDGGSIWETGYKMALAGTDGAGLKLGPAASHEDAEKRADVYAEAYGATRTEGRWGRQIGESNWDSIIAWHCPDCKHRWPRVNCGRTQVSKEYTKTGIM